MVVAGSPDVFTSMDTNDNDLEWVQSHIHKQSICLSHFPSGAETRLTTPKILGFVTTSSNGKNGKSLKLDDMDVAAI